ncbi:hypothetical protein KI387_008407, partial [Taxus chinensis]
MAISLSIRPPLRIPIHSNGNSMSPARTPIVARRRISLYHGLAVTGPQTLTCKYPFNWVSRRLAPCWGYRRLGSLYGRQGGHRIVPGVRACDAKMDGCSGSQRDVKILVAAATTVVLAVANRVLYKLALVPLKDYPFFLAQFTTFGYVLVYFSILYFRYRFGIVTDEMLAIPKLRFVAVGALEAIGLASGMAAG